MGHIELAAPVSHIWYFKGIPARMGLMLDLSPSELEKVLYFDSYIVTDPGDTPLIKKQLLTDAEYAEMRERYEDDFEAGMGAEYIKSCCVRLTLRQHHRSLKRRLQRRPDRSVRKSSKRWRLSRRLKTPETVPNG